VTSCKATNPKTYNLLFGAHSCVSPQVDCRLVHACTLCAFDIGSPVSDTVWMQEVLTCLHLVLYEQCVLRFALPCASFMPCLALCLALCFFYALSCTLPCLVLLSCLVLHPAMHHARSICEFCFVCVCVFVCKSLALQLRA